MNRRHWFAAGSYGLILLAAMHFFSNRHGLPIVVHDAAGRELLQLMQGYRINFFGLERSLDQTLAGFILTWGLMLLTAAALNLLMLSRAPEPPVRAALLNLACWSGCLLAAIVWWSWPQMLMFAGISGCFTLSLWPRRRGGGSAQPADRSAQPRIVVIGAGPAGLSAAWTLKQRGYRQVTVLEKSERAGGKCLTFEVDGKAIDFVAHEMLAGYTAVMDIATAVGAPSRGFQDVQVYNSQKRVFQDMLDASTLGGYSKLQVGWASLRYTWMLLTRYRLYARPGTGLADAPAELLQPTATWLRANGLDALELTALYVMTVQGYGRLDQVPAAYFVKFQGLRNWVSNVLHILGLIQSWPRVFTNGFQDLWNRVAARVDVRYRADITQIRRQLKPGTDDIVIQIRCADGQTLEADRLIVSCPLDLPTLQGLGLDLGATETELFAKVGYYHFVTTACRVQGLPYGVVGSVPLPGMMDYTGYIKIYRDCDVAIFFSVVPDAGADLDKVYDNIVEAVQRVPQTLDQPPRVLERLRQQNWPYFPHPDSAVMAGGYFSQIATLQGQRNTWYAASLLEMETVGNTVAFTTRLIETQFPDLT